MNSFDLIIRGGMVVTETAVTRGDVGVANGQITAIEPTLTGGAAEIIDAAGLHVFPGIIDAHVHFNEPGRSDWEGIQTGSQAVAAGGGTLFFDMPLNAHPPTVDAESFQAKQAAAEQKSVVDFALWGGLVPGNVDKLDELARCGVIGFKAFMSNSGIEDFLCVDDTVLREGMARAANLQLPVAVHAESETLTARLAAEAIAAGRTGIRDYLASRPIQAELDAIRRALDLAGETGCALHVVHVSCAAGVRLITKARKAGVDASCETCPHYFVLTDEDVEKLGAVAKCAPPLRSFSERNELWREILADNILTVGSDHSPSPPKMKQGRNFFEAWGGISGVQHLLPLLVTAGHFERGADLPFLLRLCSSNVARRFKLPSTKGQVAVGCDADLALVAVEEQFEVRAEDLFYRHRQSPYIGRQLRGAVRRTMVRGGTIFLDGKIVAEPQGRLITPKAVCPP
ncbi:MAG TPA: allantoinase AllB [Candidatus Saccharimonadales bacterium]|nr:allantoinase AllB [Candidatus Saccharimonadales bacterium]